MGSHGSILCFTGLHTCAWRLSRIQLAQSCRREYKPRRKSRIHRSWCVCSCNRFCQAEVRRILVRKLANMTFFKWVSKSNRLNECIVRDKREPSWSAAMLALCSRLEWLKLFLKFCDSYSFFFCFLSRFLWCWSALISINRFSFFICDFLNTPSRCKERLYLSLQHFSDRGTILPKQTMILGPRYLQF